MGSVYGGLSYRGGTRMHLMEAKQRSDTRAVRSAAYRMLLIRRNAATPWCATLEHSILAEVVTRTCPSCPLKPPQHGGHLERAQPGELAEHHVRRSAGDQLRLQHVLRVLDHHR